MNINGIHLNHHILKFSFVIFFLIILYFVCFELLKHISLIY
jgi:hypothetical protein